MNAVSLQRLVGVRKIGITAVLRRIFRALSFDAENIFRSKDWPHLWSK